MDSELFPGAEIECTTMAAGLHGIRYTWTGRRPTKMQLLVNQGWRNAWVEEQSGARLLVCYEMPGGKMAKTVHKGPYEDCGTTYEQLFTWLAQNHVKVTGPTREVYLNDPNEVSPEDILTEIYVPIE